MAGWACAPSVDPAPAGVLRAPYDGAHVAPTGVFDHDGGREGWQRGPDGVWARGERGHAGWDWPLPEGTPVRAAAAGRVVASGTEAPFRCPLDGRTVTDQQVVKLLHALPDGRRLVTAYAHLATRQVAEGDVVEDGAALGTVGATGCATAPHLHFAVWRSGAGPASTLVAVDPFAEGLWRAGEAPRAR